MSDVCACDACDGKAGNAHCPACHGAGRVDASEPLKVIIAGSRTVKSYAAVVAAIKASGFRIGEVVSGGAAGPDCMGESWADERGLPVRRFLANWKDFGRRAGPLRNFQMAQHADALIAVWDGESKGTADMIQQMTARKKPVYVHRVTP